MKRFFAIDRRITRTIAEPINLLIFSRSSAVVRRRKNFSIARICRDSHRICAQLDELLLRCGRSSAACGATLRRTTFIGPVIGARISPVEARTLEMHTDRSEDFAGHRCALGAVLIGGIGEGTACLKIQRTGIAKVLICGHRPPPPIIGSSAKICSPLV